MAVEIVIATRNLKKFRELKTLLRHRHVQWRSLAAYAGVPAVREDGRSFEENAVKKARIVARAVRGLALADDSGLEVAALRGAPGVRSARFAGRHGRDAANNAKLLRLLRRVPGATRRAQFRCVLALADSQRVLATVEGALQGRIALEPTGRRGFGYDPVFLVPRLKQTVAQLPLSVKNRISHRARAATRMRRRIAQLLRAHQLG